MPQHQSLQKQEEALKALREFLVSFTEDLESKIKSYKRRVDNIYDTGLSNEVYNHYSNDNYVSDKNHINSLIRHIKETDIPYIDKNLGATKGSKETASGRYKSIKLDD